MSIVLWAVRVDRSLTEAESQSALAVLPPFRRERLLHLQREDARREPLCAYALLRRALEELLGWKALPDIAPGSGGKPYFPGQPDVHFNLSHTRGAVLAGVSDQPVGVDIERIRPISQRTMLRLAGTASAQEFFQSWVRREARVKRTGQSIAAMLREEPPMEDGEFYYPLETFPGYAAGAALSSREEPEPPRLLSLEDLLKGVL